MLSRWFFCREFCGFQYEPVKGILVQDGDIFLAGGDLKGNGPWLARIPWHQVPGPGMDNVMTGSVHGPVSGRTAGCPLRIVCLPVCYMLLKICDMPDPEKC